MTRLFRSFFDVLWPAAMVAMVALCAGTTPAQDLIVESNADAEQKPLIAPVETSIGMPATMSQVILPGPALGVRPMNSRHDPFVLRIVDRQPHGDGHRYDFEFHALDAGTYNVVDYLQTSDGQPVSGLPYLIVQVRAALPAGQVLPKPLGETNLPSLGGYRWTMRLAAVAWLAGLWALLFVGRKRTKQREAVTATPLTATQQLQTLIEAARQGQLDPDRHAELERAVISFWRDRLELQGLGAAELSTTLGQHDQAGPMLEQLERWLHAPVGHRDSPDLETLLAPIAEAMASDHTDPSERSQSHAPEAATL